MRPVLELQDRMREAIGQAKRELAKAEIEQEILKVKELVGEEMKAAYHTPGKIDRYSRLDSIKNKVRENERGHRAGGAKRH